MEVKIAIEDYITPEEIKSIAMEELRKHIQSLYKGDERNINRLISNLSYEFIFKAVSDAIGDDAQTMIADKVKELCSDSGTIRYEMWRKKDNWDKEESPAIAIMKSAIRDNEDLIKAKVVQTIESFKFDDIQTAMYEALEQVVRDRIFGE